MSAKTIYRGEGLVKRWGDSSSALRTVTLQLQEDDPLSRHPFFGFDGRRVAIVIVELDETNLAGGSVPKHSAEDGPIVSRDTPPAKPNSTRAVMMAKDPEFWAFLQVRYPAEGGIKSEHHANELIKIDCNVTSKAALNEEVGARWFEKLRSDFYAWRRARQNEVRP